MDEQLYDIGEAITLMDNEDCAMARKGWNGIGIFIKMQKPDKFSKMSQRYIYIDTTGLVSDNIDAPRNRVPWLPSQTDLLAKDWVVVK
jgi:hypothetical protein